MKTDLSRDDLMQDHDELMRMLADLRHLIEQPRARYLMHAKDLSEAERATLVQLTDDMERLLAAVLVALAEDDGELVRSLMGDAPPGHESNERAQGIGVRAHGGHLDFGAILIHHEHIEPLAR